MQIFYDYDKLRDVIPTVRPRLMLDRLAIDAAAQTARGLKGVSMNEELFTGHFPGNPILPGVLQLAAMLQTAKGFIGHRDGIEAASRMALAAAERVKFRSPVYPGDILQTEIAVQEENDQAIKVKCSTTVDGKVTCQGLLTIGKNSFDKIALNNSTFAPALRSFAGDGEQLPLDINTIMERIPHRYPFLFIDRILFMDKANHRIVALKNVSGNEPFFGGGNSTIMPGYVHAEIGAQAGCTLALSEPGNENKLAFFMALDKCQFFSSVIPGDQLLIDVKVEPRGRFGRGHGEIYVGNRKVSEIDLKFAIVEREDSN